MSPGGQRWCRVWMVAALTAGLAFLSGCAAGDESTAGADERVTALGIDSPVKAPIWARDEGVLLALVEGQPQIARIDPNDVEEDSGGESPQAKSTLSGKFEDVGENLAVSPKAVGQEAYLPQPDQGQVAVINIEDLRKVDSFEAGPSPARVTTDVGSDLLFALAEDGSAVTGVNLETKETLLPPVEEVEAGQEAQLGGPERGLSSMFWIAGPNGVALYEGNPAPLEKEGEMRINAGSLAVDAVKVTRAYVGEAGTGRLVAVGLNPENGKLTVAAQTQLDEPIEYIGVDEKRVYAATQNELFVFKTENFEGFDENGFETVATINFRDALEGEDLKQAPLSGMAVDSSTEKVYLTLEGVPYLLSIDKPDY